MNFKLVLVSALAAGATMSAGMAQTAQSTPAAPAATAPAASSPATLPPPQAIPAKIAVIELEQVAEATNEGQKAALDVQKKYEPQRVKLETLKSDIDSLTKQLQSPPATMTEEEKASRARMIDTKQKQLQRDADDAQAAYGNDLQEALGKVLQKLGPVVAKYVQQNGYTMLLDNTGQPQQGGLNVLWAPGADISQAVVDAYNASSGVAAPAPSVPSATTHPKPTTPKPAAPKQ